MKINQYAKFEKYLHDYYLVLSDSIQIFKEFHHNLN